MAKRVLIVDDDADVRDVLVEAFTAAGFAAVAFASGHDALGEAPAWAPDVIIADLQMPSMTGWDLATRLGTHAQLSMIPLVVFSGSDIAPPPTALAAFRKPHGLAEIVALVQRVTGMASRAETPTTATA